MAWVRWLLARNASWNSHPTLLGGYADDVYNILFRLQPQRMIGKGYEWGSPGRSAFAQDYGVLETITKIEPAESRRDGKTTVTVRRKPEHRHYCLANFLWTRAPSCSWKTSPMPCHPTRNRSSRCRWTNRWQLPERAARSRHAGRPEGTPRQSLHFEHHAERATSLSRSPLWVGQEAARFLRDEDGRRERFLIANPDDLPEQFVYSKERRLVEEIKKELAEGRRCQVFAVYTQKRDVNSRLERILRDEGISCAVMRSNIDTTKREAWYERRLKEGVQVFIAHPKLVETGLDLLFAPTILFHESGYSLHTLRQASRRSWRIGQRQPVRVKFLALMKAQCKPNAFV